MTLLNTASIFVSSVVNTFKSVHKMNKKVLRSSTIAFLLILIGYSSATLAEDQSRTARFKQAPMAVGPVKAVPYVQKKTGVYTKVSGDLIGLQQEYTAYTSLPASAKKDPFTPSIELMRVADGYVVVDAVAVGDTDALYNQMLAMGAINLSSYGRYVSARVPMSMLDQLAGLSQLKFARPFYAETRTGSVLSQGDEAQASDIVRDTMLPPAYTGAGFDIGVLSDSYDCGNPALLTDAADDIASGDLPAGGVTVVQEEPGCGSASDEGRGMLQLVHDVAPGSDLLFHSAFGGVAAFASGIGALQSAGADVIVDDVFYFSEPMFQDGAIAQAADAVFALGVPYFSSAGNSATESYESPFSVSGNLGPSGFYTHDFDPGPGVDDLQMIDVPVGAGFTMTFQWNQPYGGATTDLDIFIVAADNSTILAAGGNVNIGGDPLEIFAFNNTGAFDFDGLPGADTTFNVLIENFQGTPPDIIKYSHSETAVTIMEYDTASGTSFGHSSAAGAAAVGAAPYFNTPAFGQTPPLQESFTSRAGVPILFDTGGTPLAAPVFRPKPNFTGPDGGNTTFFGNDIGADADTDPNFFGTSASAPHVAAGAALLLEADPTLTPSQVYSVIADSAIDMGTAGFDIDTGTGLVQFDDAEAAIANGSPTLESITSQTGRTGDVLVFNLDATVTADPEGDNIAFSQTGMPEPACVLADGGSGTGTITCTLTDNETGRYAVAVSATDDGSPPRSDIQGFYLTANPNASPTINQIPISQTMDDGDPPLVLDFSASDTDPGDVLTFSTFGRPSFCAFDTADPMGPDTAQMSCDPGFNNTGVYIITVKASDDGAPIRAAATTFVLSVANVNRDPTWDPIDDASVDEGQQIIINGTATDPDVPDPLILDLEVDEPPFCVGVDNGDGTGTLTCNPTFADAGVYPMTALVFDSFGGSDSEAFTLTVNDVNVPPELDFISDVSLANNGNVVINLTSSDFDGNNVTLSGAGVPGFCTESYPAGLGTGSLDCSPGGAGDNGPYDVTITATDDGVPNLQDQQTFRIQVVNPGSENLPPTLTVTGNVPVDDMDELTITLSSSDPNGDNMSFATNTTGVPAFCVLNDGNGSGSIVCNPSFGDEGSYPVAVRVTDDGAPPLTTTELINIVVTHFNIVPVAAASVDQEVVNLELVFLDGFGSSDFETAFENLLFSWRFVAKPPGSAVNDSVIFDRFTDEPSFIADADGTFILELSVTDEDGAVDVDTVSVTADTAQTLWFADGLNGRIDIRDAVTGLSASTGGAGYGFRISGVTVSNVPGMAVDPTTNIAYAAINRSGQTASELATFDPFFTILTGFADGTLLGSMGDRVYGIDFDSSGNLYAITADDSVADVVTPETLFSVDKSNGSMTLVQDLDDGGAPGEAIAFNRDTGTLFHASGTSFESVDTVGMTTTNIGFSGDMPGGYVLDGMTYDRDRDLLVGTRRDTSGGSFFTVTDAGVVADIYTGQASFIWQDIAFWDLAFQAPTALAANGDQTGDGNADILFRNSGDGQNTLWGMTGSTRDANTAVETVGTSWSIVGDGDYNGDGFQDILWRSDTGQVAIWLMQGATRIANLALPTVSDLNWTVVGDGDYNCDGEADILWRNTLTGANAIWQINGGQRTANYGVLTVSNTDWVVIADGDFTGDGKADILWRNTSTGVVALWEMDGAAREFNLFVATVGLDWVVVGDGDMNDDDIADVLWRKSDGQNALWTMNGASFANIAVEAVTNTAWVVAGNRDYDGDGIADILWYNTGTGELVFWGMNSGARLSNEAIDKVTQPGWGVVNLN